MQQQAYSPSLGLLLFLASIVIFLVSPRKLKTLGRMLVALLIVGLGLALIGALLRRGDPEMLGALAAQMALGAADAVGLFHVISLKRALRKKTDGVGKSG